ncbi:MAG: [Fe-Fe] hydrogenase large subunit C-terminal domain-containing protein [Planctomycetia bacterium]|nr:[Fe-Fe] hydrogenase large subunit C-terminal domain-containing protein [Planctomycetia bacterium]
MERLAPVYTVAAQCQDCYKCVRHCPSKAIRIVNASAQIIPELCVACGECIRVCPSHAKKLRSDSGRLQQMIASGERVYASIAPSFPGWFRGISIGRLAEALLEYGFAGVSETAHGAQIVSAETARFLEQAPGGVYISSACPAVVDYIRKYLPHWTPQIVPVCSPLLAHCKLLREELGEKLGEDIDMKVVFIGPCAAKKNESDAHPNLLNLSITFPSIERLLRGKGISLDSVQGDAPLVLGPAEEGRIYPIEGGMNDTIRDSIASTRYLAVSGLENLSRLLSSFEGKDLGDRKIFIEALSCRGGCVNGPVMNPDASSIETLWEIDHLAARKSSVGRVSPVDIALSYRPDPKEETQPEERLIRKALVSLGKFDKSDELNCGACGYDSCRDFAKALLEGKAEDAMCHNFLRKNYQRTSNALIRYIPAGVVIVDDNLQILESNRHFAEIIDETTLEIYDTLGTLAEIALPSLVDFSDLFESVLENGGEIEKFNQIFKDKILNISVFSITPGKTAGAVVQDVTRTEMQREQVAEKAREVIRKNVLTVQEVARLFGEHIADTQILLNEIAGTYSLKKESDSPQNGVHQ